MKVPMLVFMLCACLSSSAQNNRDYLQEQKLFEGGLFLGANMTQVDGDTYAGYNKVGIHAGAIVHVHFSKAFGVAMELLYGQKGSRGGRVKESYTIGTYIDKYYLNLNYVELPLITTFKTNPIIEYHGGFAYGRLVGAKEWAESDISWYVDPAFTWFDKNDVSWLVGASVRLSRHWYGAARYQYSLGSIRPSERQPWRYTEYTGQYNNAITLRMMYML